MNASPRDTGNLSPVEPPPPCAALAGPWSLGKAGRVARLFGPAAIVASVAIGAGETIIVVRTGAFFAYGLLWMVLASVLVKGIMVPYLLGRYTAISGESFGHKIVRLPGPRGWLLVLLAVLELAAAGPLWAAIARPSGELLGYLVYGEGVGQHADVTRMLAIAFMALALGLSLALSYEGLERQQLIICGALVLGTVVGTALVQPDLRAALAGFLSFGRIPDVLPGAPADFRQHAPAMLAVTFGYVGGSVMTYLVYPDWIALHGWGMTSHPRLEEIRRRAAVGAPEDYLPTDPVAVKAVRRSIAPLKWDVACGAIVLLVVTAAFMTAGAAVISPQVAAGTLSGAFAGWSLLTSQASIWQTIHPTLVWVYYACVLAALWGTLQAYPDIYARCVAEYADAIWPQRPWSQPRIQRWICAYVFMAATAFIWSDANFDLLTTLTAFLATNLGVAIAVLAALYLNFQLPRAYRTGGPALVGGLLAAAAMIAASAVAAWGVWQKLVG
ncbi:MAG: Nramp family divalent metal transporter [Pirellulales bacterium]|nr:Nramp family divalent metal transporter [Pirellulales bacterium]